MLRRILLITALIAVCAGATVETQTLLPNGWRLTPPQGPLAHTGTMPQGIAISPDGSTLAVVESGAAPAALRFLDARTLRERSVVPLKGAFGAPVWQDASHVIVAGANADCVFSVDARGGAVREIPTGKHSWPAAVAVHGTSIAAANDGDASITLLGAATRTLHAGGHPSAVAFSPDGATVYVAVREPSAVLAFDTSSGANLASIPVGLHPAALAVSANGATLYVAESDDDSVGIIDTQTHRMLRHVAVGLHDGRARGYGASPNALLVQGADVFVTLGAQNAVALVRADRVAERIPAGWYPTGVALGSDGTLYVANGKGEGAPANPHFDPFKHNAAGYVARITTGSVRAIPASTYARAASETALAESGAQPDWTPAPAQRTIVRANGPIRHVIYVIKENRSYDQVLGDLQGANGDPSLAVFGNAITPNQHALSRRFGIFDNAYTNSQVSADGHNWTDAAFANDYVERFWPPTYGGRRDLYDLQTAQAPDVPHNGYLWDSAARAHLSYRDYGEDVDRAPHSPIPMSLNTFAGLAGHFDPRYIGWDLHYSDSDRYAEWHREFMQFAANGNLPQLEIVYLPNDHTSGTKSGELTPQAYLAENDWAVGRLVSDISHSRYWNSTAIFILEDDAQNGPDHVSDQRSTFYIASPYALRGVHRDHYSTVSVLHTIELLLGLQPLSIYDATARPLYAAFGTVAANGTPFDAVQPGVDMKARNTKAAYGAALSAKLDFSKPDAADPHVMSAILAHKGAR